MTHDPILWLFAIWAVALAACYFIWPPEWIDDYWKHADDWRKPE